MRCNVNYTAIGGGFLFAVGAITGVALMKVLFGVSFCG